MGNWNGAAADDVGIYRNGKELEQGVVLDALEHDRVHLGDEVATLGRIERRVGTHLREARNITLEDDAHLHRIVAGEADALERNPHLDGVTLFVDHPGAEPDGVETRVLPPRCVAGVCLNAQRVDVKGVQRLFVTEGIQVDRDPVVRSDVVSARDGRLDAIRIRIVATKCEVDVFTVVGYLNSSISDQVSPVVGRIGFEAVDR